MYSLTGEFLQAYGRPGSDEVGMFNGPLICDVDAAGSVLIADRGNNRLQVMSEQGEFCVLDLQPQVFQPESAVMFSGCLYVTPGARMMSIFKYTC